MIIDTKYSICLIIKKQRKQLHAILLLNFHYNHYYEWLYLAVLSSKCSSLDIKKRDKKKKTNNNLIYYYKQDFNLKMKKY
jgi:hypothetical protein